MSLSQTAKKMCAIVAGIAAGMMLVSAVWYRSLAFIPFALGVALLSGLNVLKIYMMERIIIKSVDMDAKMASNYMKLQYLFRFTLTALVLIVAATTPFISLWGAAAGLVTLQIAAYCVKFSIKKAPEKAHE